MTTPHNFKYAAIAADPEWANGLVAQLKDSNCDGHCLEDEDEECCAHCADLILYITCKSGEISCKYPISRKTEEIEEIQRTVSGTNFLDSFHYITLRCDNFDKGVELAMTMMERYQLRSEPPQVMRVELVHDVLIIFPN